MGPARKPFGAAAARPDQHRPEAALIRPAGAAQLVLGRRPVVAERLRAGPGPVVIPEIRLHAVLPVFKADAAQVALVHPRAEAVHPVGAPHPDIGGTDQLLHQADRRVFVEVVVPPVGLVGVVEVAVALDLVGRIGVDQFQIAVLLQPVGVAAEVGGAVLRLHRLGAAHGHPAAVAAARIIHLGREAEFDRVERPHSVFRPRLRIVGALLKRRPRDVEVGGDHAAVVAPGVVVDDPRIVDSPDQRLGLPRLAPLAPEVADRIRRFEVAAPRIGIQVPRVAEQIEVHRPEDQRRRIAVTLHQFAVHAQPLDALQRGIPVDVVDPAQRQRHQPAGPVGLVEQVVVELRAAADPPCVFVGDHQRVEPRLAVQIQHRQQVVLRGGHECVAVGRRQRDQPEGLAVQHHLAPVDPDFAETEPARQRVFHRSAVAVQHRLRLVQIRVVGLPQMRVAPRTGEAELLHLLAGELQPGRKLFHRRFPFIRPDHEPRPGVAGELLRIRNTQLKGDFAPAHAGFHKEVVHPEPRGTDHQPHVLRDAAQRRFLFHIRGHLRPEEHLLLAADRRIDPDHKLVDRASFHLVRDVPESGTALHASAEFFSVQIDHSADRDPVHRQQQLPARRHFRSDEFPPIPRPLELLQILPVIGARPAPAAPFEPGRRDREIRREHPRRRHRDRIKFGFRRHLLLNLKSRRDLPDAVQIKVGVEVVAHPEVSGQIGRRRFVIRQRSRPGDGQQQRGQQCGNPFHFASPVCGTWLNNAFTSSGGSARL